MKRSVGLVLRANRLRSCADGGAFGLLSKSVEHTLDLVMKKAEHPADKPASPSGAARPTPAQLAAAIRVLDHARQRSVRAPQRNGLAS